MKKTVYSVAALILALLLSAALVPTAVSAESAAALSDDAAWQTVLDAYNLFFFIGSADTYYPHGKSTVDFSRYNTVGQMDAFAKSIYDESIADYFWRTGLRLDGATDFFRGGYSFQTEAEKQEFLLIPYDTPSQAPVIGKDSQYLFFDIPATLQKNECDRRLPSAAEARLTTVKETETSKEYKFIIWLNQSAGSDNLPIPAYMHVVFRCTEAGWRITESPFAQWMLTTQVTDIMEDSIVGPTLGYSGSPIEAVNALFVQANQPYQTAELYDKEEPDSLKDPHAISYLGSNDKEITYCIKLYRVNSDQSKTFLGYYDAVFPYTEDRVWKVVGGGVLALAQGESPEPCESPYTGSADILPTVILLCVSLAILFYFGKRHSFSHSSRGFL